ncbi:MAG: glycosyltransferase [Clostridiales bacterium]|jgi:glycosyltransferase involved in cell wall biosynthesis|nr:glycosyltransferase [Clostridiales bacterium]
MISIIVPVYNVGRYLGRCVDSLLVQTYADIEVVLVDDGSTDGCAGICDGYARGDARVRAIHQENGGLSRARNAGLDIMRGEYVAFVDSDDYVSEDFCRTLLGVMRRFQSDLAICSRFYVSENGRKTMRFKSSGEDALMDSEQAILEMNSYRSFDWSACGKLYKRELFSNVRFPEGKVSEDKFVAYKLLLKAGRIVYHPEPLYYYFQRSGSLSRRKKIDTDMIEATWLQMRDAEKVYPRLKEILHCNYALVTILVYGNHLRYKAPINKEDLQRYVEIVRDNEKYVFNSGVSALRKIQAWLFTHCLPAFRVLFLLYKKIDRV